MKTLLGKQVKLGDYSGVRAEAIRWIENRNSYTRYSFQRADGSFESELENSASKVKEEHIEEQPTLSELKSSLAIRIAKKKAYLAKLEAEKKSSSTPKPEQVEEKEKLETVLCKDSVSSFPTLNLKTSKVKETKNDAIIFANSKKESLQSEVKEVEKKECGVSVVTAQISLPKLLSSQEGYEPDSPPDSLVKIRNVQRRILKRLQSPNELQIYSF